MMLLHLLYNALVDVTLIEILTIIFFVNR